MTETIKTYAGQDVGASQCLVTLEGFIGDMDNAELADDSTVDTNNAVTAINGLIWSLERREAEIERLQAALHIARTGLLKIERRCEEARAEISRAHEQSAARCDMCGEPKDGRDHSGCDRAYPETLK